MFASFLVFLGAGIGGTLRHLFNLGCVRLCGPSFPWGTLGVNILGSFAMGLLVGWLAFRSAEAWTPNARLFLATGVLGGFTTFSSFSLDSVLLFERGEVMAAGGYVLASVSLSILALCAGLALVRMAS